jgi:ribosome-associated translation inhibitor RaiA
MNVEIAVPEATNTEIDNARERFRSLQEHASTPLIGPRLVVRPGGGSFPTKPTYVADASLRFDGRLLAAHATGPTVGEATGAVVERLKRQLRRNAEIEHDRRHEPSTIRTGLEALQPASEHRPAPPTKPPGKREIVHQRTYALEPLATLQAVADMLDLDEEFHLFHHVRTGEDVVVYRLEDGRIGLIFPQGSPLADEDDLVVAEPSRYSSPLTLDAARTEMDELNHRYLYFTDAADDCGKVLYLRHDGDYGLVEPE